MNEQETNEENKTETTTGTSDDGAVVKTTPLIDVANQAAERMEKANVETARLQQIQIDIQSRIALGGKADAGKPEKEELTEEEKASRARIKAVGDATASQWAKNYE